jgi:hypothetical protein
MKIVGRTLLSVGFDPDFDLEFDVDLDPEVGCPILAAFCAARVGPLTSLLRHDDAPCS